ncbi:MAG: NADH-quinone oxidoreductase subunit C [Acidimicrobiia bacterium]|nr:NADH-quinone oxidoreductase subunit C [Acidimicrobiia bacterium]MBT8217698.1 NADH-quinone oxidoreductase subunit C [Acidimicrobiia bacterium]NNF10440.1 NADH-quinone oxidoreductase subunit C [Acidimicrobiia bacterium]NNL69495.1 NADH-quinone oxidoreductase subunit C [Acidimicrobiia bacterium]
MSEEIVTPEQGTAEAPKPVLPPPLAEVTGAFPEATLEESATGQNVVRVDAGRLVEFTQACRDAGFEMFIDVTAVDYRRQRPGPRYDVVILLLSLQHNLRIRILAGVDGEVPTAPSITSVYPGANFYEREVYDLFGIEFTGHPDLTRIMLPDDWSGHPLRKDSPVGSVPIQFKGTNKVQ